MHPYFKVAKQSPLGRVKARILEEISGTEDRVPSDREVITFLMQKWKENSEAGRILFHLIFHSTATRIFVPKEFSLEKAQKTLSIIASLPPIRVGLTEAHFSTAPTESVQCGVLHGHKKPDGKPGYYFAVFSEQSFPSLTYLSIALPVDDSTENVSILEAGGWRRLNLSEAVHVPEVKMALALLQQFLPVTPVKVKIERIKMNKDLEPPIDPECLKRLQLAMQNKLPVTVAEVRMDEIRPHNTEHCYKVPRLSDQLRMSDLPLLLYWHNDSFVMSDDYSSYVTYRQENRITVKAAIMGKFPVNKGAVEKIGGKDLIPGVVIDSGTPKVNDEDFKQWQLDRHLSNPHRRPLPADQIAIWLCFAELLNDASASERQLHDFILMHPAILSVYGKYLRSEVRLGEDYRIDLVMASTGVRHEITLIELESHDNNLFTRSGRPNHKVTHAIQQVNDWIQWIGQHPNAEISQSFGGRTPKGLVVMGKSRILSEPDRDRLAHLNSRNSVELISYDELLDRFGNWILNLCDGD